MTKSVSVHEAKTHLSRFLQLVEAGEEVIITRRGEVVARLVPPGPVGRRELGFDRGRVSVPDDLNDPLPPEVLSAFES